MSFKLEEDPRVAGNSYFATTQWGLILSARTANSAQGSDAMEKLCRVYWYPVYSYILWRGYGFHDAQDLTQEFFAQYLAKDLLRNVDQSRGKFRTFLLTVLNHFLINQSQRVKAQKRGGRFTFVPLDNGAEQERHFCEPVSDLSPEEVFDQRWALTVLEQALKRLELEFTSAGKAGQFQILRAFLEGDSDAGAYRTVGAQLGMTPGAVAVAVHRLRQRFSSAIRDEISQTVANSADVEAEMRHLLQAIR